jgi:hypothetical protein
MQKKESLFDHQKEKLVVGQKTQILKYETDEKEKKEKRKRIRIDNYLLSAAAAAAAEAKERSSRAKPSATRCPCLARRSNTSFWFRAISERIF